jgi:TPR repeat protein
MPILLLFLPPSISFQPTSGEPSLSPEQLAPVSEVMKQLADDNAIAHYEFLYGFILYHGVAHEQDFTTAVRYFKKAAHSGEVNAQYYLGKCLRSGQGIDQDFAQAAHYLKLAADAGLSRAQIAYGDMIRRGEIPRNLTTAARYFKLAADQGDEEGQFKYGCFLNNGDGVEANLDEALKYFKRAGARGHSVAAAIVAYYEGDEDTAFELWPGMRDNLIYLDEEMENLASSTSK